MLSRFGKTLRKIRIDHSLTLGELGKRLSVSPAFLSALERGKAVPAQFVDKLKIAISLTDAEYDELCSAAAQQVKEVTLNVSHRSDNARELAVAFARSFESMSEDDLKKMLDSLTNR